MYKTSDYSPYDQYCTGETYSNRELYQTTTSAILTPSNPEPAAVTYPQSQYTQYLSPTVDTATYVSFATPVSTQSSWENYRESDTATPQYQQLSVYSGSTPSFSYPASSDSSLLNRYEYQEKTGDSQVSGYEGKSSSLFYGSYAGKYSDNSSSSSQTYGFRGKPSTLGNRSQTFGSATAGSSSSSYGSQGRSSKSNLTTLSQSTSYGYPKSSSYYSSQKSDDNFGNLGSEKTATTTSENSSIFNGDHITSYTSPLMAMDSKRGYKPPPPQNTIPNNKRPLPIELDPNLPQEIVARMKTFSCGICAIKLNSRSQAKTHYEGKPHARKQKAAVDELKGIPTSPTTDSAETDSDKSKTDPPAAKKKKTSDIDGSKLYCKCCDLSFTSADHATQHYLGRNHQRVLHGLKPLKIGYYNKETGKWQRSPPDPRVTAEILSDDKQTRDPDSVKEKGKFFCELCGVSATSQDQLDGHMKGQRHKKTEVMANKKRNQSSSSGSRDSILASVIKGDEAKKIKYKDLSIYRTPSGNYYCSPCDLTLNSEIQFSQHVDSKKHKLQKK